MINNATVKMSYKMERVNKLIPRVYVERSEPIRKERFENAKDITTYVVLRNNLFLFIIIV